MQGIDIGRKLALDEYAFIRQRGLGFVWRYSDGSRGASAKAGDAQEQGFARRHGLLWLLVFEKAGAAPLTYQQGMGDGIDARADALSVGYPLGWPLPTANATDTDIDPTTPGFLDYCNGYYDGLDGAYLAGVYGSYRVCKHVRENFPGFGFTWQTHAWSGGQVYAPANCYQHTNGFALRPGLVVDLNSGDLGPWG